MNTFHNLILPYIGKPGPFFEFCAGCRLLEVGNLSKVANVAHRCRASCQGTYFLTCCTTSQCSIHIVVPGAYLGVCVDYLIFDYVNFARGASFTNISGAKVAWVHHL